jgi:hypothetical protein
LSAAWAIARRRSSHARRCPTVGSATKIYLF